MPVRSTTPSVRVAVALLVIVLLGVLAPAAGAAPNDEDLREAKARLDAAENDFNLAVDRYEEARAELASLQGDTADAQRRVTQLRARAAEGRKSVTKAATRLYRNAGQGELAMLLSANGIEDATRRISYLEAIQQAQTRVVERATADQRALEASLVQLRETTGAAQATFGELSRMRGELESMVARRRNEVAGIQGVISGAQRASREREALRSGEASRNLRPPRLGPDPLPLPGPALGPRSGAQGAVQAALSQVGKPYRWGASGPGSYDCSGLTLWAWARVGVSLPHSSRAQYAATRRVARGQWQPGDLLFFGSPIHHVGMYVGEGKMVAAPHSGANVRVSSATSRRDYVGAGRP